jgi:acetyl coenzyme A synthetase (ADP forming)-like protein
MAIDAPAYPSDRQGDVVLRDGSTATIRPVRPDDEAALLRFFESLSNESRYLRFFSGAVNLQQAAVTASRVDYHDRYGLIATAGMDGAVIANGMYLKTTADRAEVAFAVIDAYQGHGLGTLLLGQLAEVAEEAGISVFEALVLPENHQMIEVFRQSGFSVRTTVQPGQILVEFPTSISPDAIERFERRGEVAAVNAMRAFFEPSSVAVIGASRKRGTIGGELFHNLLSSGFPGPVYPVNRETQVVQSVPAYRSVLDIPGPVDLAVIAVPAAAVLEVAHECAAKRVSGLVVISAGFGESGPEGKDRERQLLDICRASGMRLIGPNCMGIVNTAKSISLNATFGPEMPAPGNVGFLSQSGALGLAVIDYARALGLGISTFVSVGNKADISGNDLISYWDADRSTQLILLYLESFGNPRRFAKLSRRVAQTKPIIAVKSGRTPAGARATSSHTGALVAASDATVDALFHQAGVIRTDTLSELFDAASLLANQPLPTGRRVAILTNAGGPGILCADACEANGLQVLALPDAVQQALAKLLPQAASTRNPVDMLAGASAEDFRRAIRILSGCREVDAIIVIFIPPLSIHAEDVALAIRTAARELARPVPLLTVFMSSHGVPAELRRADIRVPSYAFPEDAARALSHAVRYSTWRGTPQGEVQSFAYGRPDEAAALLAAALTQGPHWLPPDQVFSLLSCYGVPVLDWRVVESAAEAAQASTELGGLVALKAVAANLIHKSDAGAVRLNLPAGPSVAAAASEMSEAVAHAGFSIQNFLVQRMATEGVEMLVGMVNDRSFGPVVVCGAGGTAAELIKDVAIRIVPLTDRDADEMVRSLRTFPLLDGYRGRPRANVPSLEEVLLRVAAMVEAHPAIAELDLNPVMVTPDRTVVVDARIRVETVPHQPPLGSRRRHQD